MDLSHTVWQKSFFTFFYLVIFYQDCSHHLRKTLPGHNCFRHVFSIKNRSPVRVVVTDRVTIYSVWGQQICSWAKLGECQIKSTWGKMILHSLWCTSPQVVIIYFYALGDNWPGCFNLSFSHSPSHGTGAIGVVATLWVHLTGVNSRCPTTQAETTSIKNPGISRTLTLRIYLAIFQIKFLV